MSARPAGGPVFRDAKHLAATMARIDRERARRRPVTRALRIAGLVALALVLLGCDDPHDTPGRTVGLVLIVASAVLAQAGLAALHRARIGGTR